jgi:hypothetical protein
VLGLLAEVTVALKLMLVSRQNPGPFCGLYPLGQVFKTEVAHQGPSSHSSQKKA